MHEWRNPLELGLPGGLIAAVPERRGGRRKQRSGQTKPVRSIGSDARGTRMIRRRYPSYAFGSIAQSLARAKHSTSVLPDSPETAKVSKVLEGTHKFRNEVQCRLTGETILTFGLWFAERRRVNRILRPVTYVLAAIYFVVDAAFIVVAKPISTWIAKHLVLRKLRAWIRSLRPYPSLALFSLPVIILEPVKPVAAYLAATGQIVSSVVTLIVGELLKLVLVERLFSLTRDKLMKIPAFAWAYAKFRQAKAWLEATEAWRTVRSLSKAARSYVAQMKTSGAVPFRQS